MVRRPKDIVFGRGGVCASARSGPATQAARTSHIAKGREAELAAHRYLLQHGYLPVARNVRTRYGEIDIVARDGTTLVFVEVKSQSGACSQTRAAEAVGPRKQGGLRALAWYLRAGVRAQYPMPVRRRPGGLSAVWPPVG